MKTNCYIHENKPAMLRQGGEYARCNDCGGYICSECAMGVEISTRTAATLKTPTEITEVIEHVLIYYCPKCYISLAEKNGYDKPPDFFYIPKFGIISVIFMVIGIVAFFYISILIDVLVGIVIGMFFLFT